MATRIFSVDLSENARDYRPIATEPGLAMLDRAGTNHKVLRRWLGDFVAEPEFQRPDRVDFFIREEERGRLETVECYPVTKAELESSLKEDLAALSARVKKAKPNTGTEQALHRVMTQRFQAMTRNLDDGEFEGHFFHYREPGQPWRLVWCWGYQRVDAEPASPAICADPECNLLFLQRADGAGCVCATNAGVRRRRTGWDYLYWPLAALALLLLLGLGLGVFMLLNPPRLVVTPERWAGIPDSRVPFQIVDQRWYFFTDDVTDRVLPQSQDNRIAEFRPNSTVLVGKSVGETRVSFLLENRVATAQIGIGPPDPPERIEVVPDTVKLGIGSVAEVKVIGYWDDGRELDITSRADWQVPADTADLVYISDGLLEGAVAGETKVKARVPNGPFGGFLEQEVAVTVVDVKYTALEVAVEPNELSIGQSGYVDVHAQGADGERYWMTGSTQLFTEALPANIAYVDGNYVLGKAGGSANVNATLSERLGAVSGSGEITVLDASLVAAGTLSVAPLELEIARDEYFDFDVIAAPGEIVTTTSSDPEVVEVLAFDRIVGLRPGTAQVTFQLGDREEVATVTVKDRIYDEIYVLPKAIVLGIDQVQQVRVIGRTPDGQEVELAGKDITWVQQPETNYVYFDREALLLQGKRPTNRPQILIAALDPTRQSDPVSVEVRGDGAIASLAIDDEFGAHPPVAVVNGRAVLPATSKYLGTDDLVYRDDGLYLGEIEGGPLVDLRIPRDARIVGFDDVDIRGMSYDEVRDYLAGAPIEQGTVLEYLDADGNIGRVRLGPLRALQPVKVVDVRPANLTANDFKAEVFVDLLSNGEYRVANGEGEPITEWKPIDRGPGRLVTDSVERVGDDDHNYKMYIERKQGDRVERYEFQFRLKADEGPAPTGPLTNDPPAPADDVGPLPDDLPMTPDEPVGSADSALPRVVGESP